MDYVRWIILPMLLSIVMSPSFAQLLRCIRPELCMDEMSSREFRCVEVGYECCQLYGGEVRLFESPRGSACCQGGAGMYDMQTHSCQGNETVRLPATEFCPGSVTTLYNMETQTCCRGQDTIEPKVHMIESGGSCCGSEYIIHSIQGCCSGVPYELTSQCCKESGVVSKSVCDESNFEIDGSLTCKAPGICYDEIVGETFQCLEREHECCNNFDGVIRLSRAPRGSLCCAGAGMYRVQTHQCVSGHLIKKSQARFCARSKTYFNNETEICCYNDRNVPKVFMKQIGHSCCGHSYIHDSTAGCCNGVPYDKASTCCLSNRILPKHSCPILDPECPSIECSLNGKDLTGKPKPKSHFAYAFKAGDLVKTDNKYRYFKVTDVRQLKGMRKGKVASFASKHVRKIAFPKCGCRNHIQAGQNYILTSPTRIRPTTRLRTGKFSLEAVTNSAAFELIFEVRQS